MTKAQELAQLGQSIWYDNIRRAELESGHLKALVDAGVRGVTSNPTIFDKAIAGSADYDAEMKQLVQIGKSVDQIFETLVIGDIRHAADVLRPVFDQTNGLDGYVSLEVSPKLAHDTAGTITDARRLFKLVGRPNVMIKVPATPAGIPAIETLIGDGININITLIFALELYEAVIGAYLAGLEKLLKAGGNLRRVASVASFFVSRVDTAVDAALAKKGNTDLRGKIAIANAKVAYVLFKKYFSGPRWEKLAAQGATVQRPLWASTGTKDPAYPDTLYLDTLIGPHTVNTVPPATLTAFQDHGTVALTVETGAAEAQAQIDQLASLGIDFKAITRQLMDEGVAAFTKSFESLMQSIADKRARLIAEAQGRSASLGTCQPAIDAALKAMDAKDIVSRIWLKDHTVWRPNAAEISNRLGWLDCPTSMLTHLDLLNQLCNEVGNDGYTHALVMGMGGSSLAPEVFAKTFGVQTAFFDVSVLDSTDADAVQAYAAKLNPAKTLFIVSTKSGGTVETMSFFKYFYNKTVEAVGAEKAGQHFIVITDPGSTLIELAKQYKFRATLLNDSNIGGRYSALSLFGLVPATLDGLDVYQLLRRAALMAEACGPTVPEAENPGAWLGAVLGELAKAGHDKVTFAISPEIASFGDWVEQLIAESTGKEGKGILPVVGEPLGAPGSYGTDRLFVQLKLGEDTTHETALASLEKAGHPVLRLHLNDLHDLGAQYFLWEMAIAVAGHVMDIQPFDQPNVESAKVLARKMVAAYNETGKLPAQTPTLTDGAISVYGSAAAKSAVEALQTFLKAAQPGDYVALQAYVQPTPETDALLLALRLWLRDHLRLATTVGYGPRFLHSTGQLHKGDRGNGLFVQFTSDPAHDAPIPDMAGSDKSSMSFGVLKLAQALGDQQALLENKRRVIRLHLGKEVLMGLERLREGLA